MNKKYFLIGTPVFFAIFYMIGLPSQKKVAKKIRETEKNATSYVIPNLPIEEKMTIKDSEYQGWSAQTKVILYLDDGDEVYEEGSGFFGQLKKSKNKRDSQDIKSDLIDELEVVFPKKNWAEESGFYRSDYREWRGKRGITQTLEWEFEIQCHASERFEEKLFEIFIDGIYDVIERMEDDSLVYSNNHYLPQLRKEFFLIDRDNDKRYRYTQLKNIRFKMNDECIRRFTWSSEKIFREDELKKLVIQDRKKKIISDFNDTPPRTSGNFGLPPF